MGFVYSSDDIARLDKHYSEGFTFGTGNTAVMVSAVFRTKEDVVKRVIPPTFEPFKDPIGGVYVVEYPRTNIGVSSNEAAVYFFVQYKGAPGRYCLTLPVTNEMSLIGGREIYGFPKKMAEKITVEREGDNVTGVCIRKGIKIIEVKVNLTGPGEPPPPLPPWYLTKYFPHPKLGHFGWTSESTEIFDFNPRVIKCTVEIDWGKIEAGEGQILFGNSQDDPLHEIPVEAVLGASFYDGMEIRLLPGEVVGEIDPVKFRPYAFGIWGARKGTL